MAKTEIRAEFKLDDMASASLTKIQGGFGKLTGTINNATSSLGDFLKQTAAVAIGVNLGNIMGSMKDVATSAFRSAVDADMQMRALTRTMEGLSSTRGRSLSSFQNEAKGVYSALSDIARVSGVARGEIVKAFQDAGANTVLTGAKLTEFVGKAALISRGMGIPVQEVTAGFESLRKNMVDASNPMVALVKQANLMRGHSERIAMKMQMMGRGGMIRLAEKAMGIMAERAKSIPLTFDEMGAQLGDMKDDMLKLIGGPMVNTLRPLFERFTGFIQSNRGAIAEYAETMGKQAGVWINRAAEAAQAGVCPFHPARYDLCLNPSLNSMPHSGSWRGEPRVSRAVSGSLSPDLQARWTRLLLRRSTRREGDKCSSSCGSVPLPSACGTTCRTSCTRPPSDSWAGRRVRLTARACRM